MFEQLQIRIKRGSRVTGPDESWTSRDRLYCAGILQTGFGEVFTWHGNELLSLHNLIALYHDLGRSLQAPDASTYLHAFPYHAGSIQLQWTLQEDANLDLTLYHVHHPSTRAVLHKSLTPQVITAWRKATYAQLLGQVTETVPPAISLKVGELFAPGTGNGYRFSPGQKVRTILSSYVRQLRIGYVLHCIRQENGQNNCYQLLVNGKPLKKLYLEEELEPMA